MQGPLIVQKLKQAGEALLPIQNLIAENVLALLVRAHLVLQKDNSRDKAVCQNAGHKAALGD